MNEPVHVSTGVLSNKSIIHHLNTTKDIVIHPFYEDQLSTSSYDVTLGIHYCRENENFSHLPFNPWNASHIKNHWKQPEVASKVGDENIASHYGCEIGDRVILIEPNETILAHTNEFIGGRKHITTMMKARSSMGRCGVSVCKCAGWGDVGYINRWTMEIQNASRSPVVLIVGQKIAQIIFFETGDCIGSYEDVGSYQIDSSQDLVNVVCNWKPTDIIPRIKKISNRTMV